MTGDHNPERGETIVVDGDRRKIVITIEVGGTCSPGGSTNGGGTPPANEGATTMPFLMIPSVPGDSGTRPLPVDQALTNQSITADIANPDAARGWRDFAIQLSCVVANLGAGPSSAGMIEFYVGANISIWNLGHRSMTPAQVQTSTHLVGRGSFTVPPGAAVTVRCPQLWVPGKSDVAQKGVLVQVTDLFADRITAPFDAIGDRHVSRNDEVMDPIIF
jgi:hypothetical protein